MTISVSNKTRSVIRKLFHPACKPGDTKSIREDFLRASDLAVVSSSRKEGRQLALVAGWFSYKNACATFGDTEAMHVVTNWLKEANIPYHIACHHVNGTDGLDINTLDPMPYNIFIFVCGPWRIDSSKILARFRHCYKIGVDLSMEDPVHMMHGFDAVLARDAPSLQNPDLAFTTPVPALPLIGIAQVHPQIMYGDRQRHKQVEQAINEFLSRGEVAHIVLDTLHLDNPVKIDNVVQYENIVGRLDAVITTRLHGLVFAIKKCIPAIAIDAIAGGAKVTAQANAIGWPLILNGDTINADAISKAVKSCINGSLNRKVIRARENALRRAQHIKTEFLEIITAHEP